jgi:hypothetical protein
MDPSLKQTDFEREWLIEAVQARGGGPGGAVTMTDGTDAAATGADSERTTMAKDAIGGTTPTLESVISMSCRSTRGIAEQLSPDGPVLFPAFLACIGQICPG